MFVGHYGAGLAAKGVDSRIPLWLLFVACQLVDILWAVLVMADVEQVRIVEGFTAANHLDLHYIPYTHSLTASVAWAALAALAFVGLARWRGWRGSALLVGAVVLSHWFIDLPVHVPDLPLVGDSYKQGFGLWNSLIATFVLEGVLLFGGLALYLRGTRASTPGGRYAMVVYALIMYAMLIAFTFGAAPPGPMEMAATGLLGYVAFAAVAYWLDRKRVAA